MNTNEHYDTQSKPNILVILGIFLVLLGVIALLCIIRVKTLPTNKMEKAVVALANKENYFIENTVCVNGEETHNLEVVTSNAIYTEVPIEDDGTYGEFLYTEYDASKYEVVDWLEGDTLYSTDENNQWVSFPEDFSHVKNQRALLNYGVVKHKGSITKTKTEDGGVIYLSKADPERLHTVLNYTSMGYLNDLLVRAEDEGNDAMEMTLQGLLDTAEVDYGIKDATWEVKIDKEGVLVGTRLSLDTEGGVIEYIRTVHFEDIPIRETPDFSEAQTYWDMLIPLSEVIGQYDSYEEGMDALSNQGE